MRARIVWNANTEPDLGGYRIYWGYSPGIYSTIVQVTVPSAAGPLVVQWTLTGLPDRRTIYFAVTAVDLSNNESGFSAEVHKINKEVKLVLN